MATQNEKLAAYEAWRAATDALQQAVFPPVGHEAPSLEVKQGLVANLEQRLAAFKAAYDL